jgi:hypothetical protein
MGDKGRARRPQKGAVIKWLKDVAEPLIAVVLGFVLAGLGLFGVISGDKLTAITLAVLGVVALSLLRERELRVNANDNVEKLGTRLDRTVDAINAIQTGNPHTVLEHDAVWDIIEPDGSLAVATRTKTLRIDQNKVVSLYDFAEGDGTRDIVYDPGEAAGRILGEGRWLTLVNLGRVYYRGDQFDFKVTRTAHGAFTSDRESIRVLTRDQTIRMRLTIKWPKERPPKAISVSKATAAEEWRNEDVIQSLETDDDGRPMYKITIRDPEKGGATVIEWDW